MPIDRPLDEQTIDELRSTFADILRDTTQLPGSMALQGADAVLSGMQSILAGQRLNVPAEKQVDADGIAADWDAGYGVGQIVQRHACSRSTAYAHHPSKRRGKGNATGDRKAGRASPAGATGKAAAGA